jgi:hypothetical protein
MNRYLSEQLMTVEEAERLSELHTGRNRRKQPVRQPGLWVWADVAQAATPAEEPAGKNRASRLQS